MKEPDQSIVRTAGPAEEPLTVDADDPDETYSILKHLNISATDDNAQLTGFIKAARLWVEKYCRRTLGTSTWVQRLDYFPTKIKLLYPPLLTVTTVKYIDTNGDQQTLDSSVYDVDIYGVQGTIIQGYNQVWPAIRSFRNAVEVTFTAGYGANREDLPMDITNAIKMIVGHWYEHREDVVMAGSPKHVPMGAKAMLSSYRVLM